jgi:hypothetical protein
VNRAVQRLIRERIVVSRNQLVDPAVALAELGLAPRS